MSKLKKQKADYEAFRRNFLIMTAQSYGSVESLKALEETFDTVIVGSDQVWNIHMPDFDESFFLYWAAHARKIACAASLGGSSFHDYPEKEKLKQALQSYYALSVREPKASEEIQGITGCPVPVLADPTLLAETDTWDSLAGEALIRGKYIFYYSWAYDNKKLRKIVSDYARAQNLPVYVINASKWKVNPSLWGFTLCKEGGPQAFLNLMKYAHVVFVESFHGVIFADIFRRDFYYLDEHPRDCPLDPRLDEILTLLDRKDRIVREFTDIEEKHIDYHVSSQKKTELKNISLQYLKKALE